MRVLWLHQRDPRSPRAGGAERLLVEVGKRLASKGHTVEIITGEAETFGERHDLNGAHVQSWPGTVLPRIAGVARTRRAPFPDVVIDDLSHLVPWASLPRPSLPSTALFLHLHARTLAGQVSPLARPFLLGLEHLYPVIYGEWPFVTISESSKRDLITLGLTSDRVTVIPPGVDTAVCRPLQLTEKPQLIYFSGMRAYKRPEHALLLLQGLRERGIDANLLMVGAGPSTKKLRKLAESLGVNVEFLGRLDDETLHRTLGQSWVHVQCSVSEGWGLAAMEAAASGVPTISYASPGATEAILPGVSGVLVGEGDIEGMIDAATSVISTRAAWTSRCRNFAISRSWDEVSNKWEAYLSRIVREFV